MKKQFITVIALISISLGLSFCSEAGAENTNSIKTDAKEFTEANAINVEGKDLLESKCMVCHKIQDDKKAMLAPPFAHIKRKYSKVMKSEQAFTDALVEFTVKPNKEDAMMFGALKQFGVMPNMNFDKAEVEKIAAYIYATDFPEPEWCNK